MHTQVETIAGETPGLRFELVIHRFEGTESGAPAAYLQAALHGDERPGVAALHYLMPMLARAEAEGRIRGAITLVPQANPIGAAQHLMSEHMGRFSLATRTNFNREFPVPDDSGVTPLDAADAPVPAERRLKSRLLELATAHPIVLDLHCDDEGLCYLYVPGPLWPDLQDLAACLGAKAAIRWTGMPDRAFEEAVFAHMAGKAGPDGDLSGFVATTVEFRGQLDVDPETARGDARGLYAFLVKRGVIADSALEIPALAPDFAAAPITHVEMVRAPEGGTILFHVRPGDRVAEGQLLAEILARPGEAAGTAEVRAPQAGLVLTRRMRRFIRRGDDLMKIVAARPSETGRDGTLEA